MPKSFIASPRITCFDGHCRLDKFMTLEDTYREDGPNLYAYCRNNPVYYADPSGRIRQCVKETYDRICKENPDMPIQDAYKRALEETEMKGVLDDKRTRVFWKEVQKIQEYVMKI